jgi:DNA-binding FadR family transcriptional regulator
VVSADPGSIIREMSVAVEHFLADPRGAGEVQMARKLLECSLAREAAKRIDAAARLNLHRLLERSGKCRDDAEAFESLELEFHDCIIRVAEDRVFEVAFAAMNQWLRDQRTV